MELKVFATRSAVLLCITGAMCTLFFIPLPKWGPWVDAFYNFCHFPVFVFFGILLSWATPIGKPVMRYGVAFALVLALGWMIEQLQPFFHRRGSLTDFIIDVCGGVMGVCLYQLFAGAPRQRRWHLTVCCGVALLIGGGIPLWHLWEALGS